jgi:hypothetical protein
MSKKFKTVKYDELFKNINDFFPDKKDDNWKEQEDYFVYDKLPTIEYNFSELDIESIKKQFVTYDKSENKKNDDPIYVLIKLEDGTNNIFTRTSKSLKHCVMDLFYYYYKNTENQSSPLYKFEDLTKIKISVINFYKNISIQQITDIKKSYDINKVSSKGEKIEKISYNTYIENLVKDLKLSEKTYYIYKLFDVKYDDETYIFYSKNKKIKINEIIKYLKECECINLKSEKKKMELLEEINVTVLTECLLKVDEYIKKYDTIETGLNQMYNLGDHSKLTKNKIFRMVQSNIMEELLEFEIKNGYVGYIEYDKKKYIFSGYCETLKDYLKYLYLIDKPEKQYVKIYEILSFVPFTDLIIKILRNNIEESELRYYEKLYIQNMDTLNNGYNDYYDYYEKTGNMNMGKMFAILKNKK